MTGALDRPALAAALACISDVDDPAWWTEVLARPNARPFVLWVRYSDSPRWEVHAVAEGRDVRRPALVIPERVVVGTGEVFEAHTIESAEALEAARARGLWPWDPGDEAAPRWWCRACVGSGMEWVPGEEGTKEADPCAACGVEDPEVTGGVRADGSLDAPSDLADFAAWVSLGVERLRQIEEHVARLRASRIPGENWPLGPLVLRAMGRDELRERHRRTNAHLVDGDARTLADAFAREECHRTRPRGTRGPGVEPWYPPGFDDDRPLIRRAWAPMGALAAMGVHLLNDYGALVLAVEGVGVEA